MLSKYVIAESEGKELVVLGSKEIRHDTLAHSFVKSRPFKIVAAGFFKVLNDGVEVDGESETLSIGNRGDKDKNAIKRVLGFTS